MSISTFDSADNPSASSTDKIRYHGQIIDLETGELFTGDIDALLDGVFGAATAERSEPFSERAPQRREAPGLVQRTISGEGRKILVNVHADMMQAARVSEVDEAAAPDRVKTFRDKTGGAKRGVVVGFSRRSRSGMLRTLASIRNVSGAWFAHLTLPDSIVAQFIDPVALAEFIKRKLHAFEKRLTHQFPEIGCIWRMEFQPRKSGAFIGLEVPHLHILMFGLENMPKMYLREWVADSWFAVIGSGEEAHHRAGTRIDPIHSRRHAAAYCAKYVGKEEKDELAAGRRWGTFGKLDLSASVSVELDDRQWINFKRLVRGWLKAKGSRYAVVLSRMPATVGMTILGLGDGSAAFAAEFGATVFRMLSAVGAEIA